MLVSPQFECPQNMEFPAVGMRETVITLFIPESDSQRRINIVVVREELYHKATQRDFLLKKICHAVSPFCS